MYVNNSALIVQILQNDISNVGVM